MAEPTVSGGDDTHTHVPTDEHPAKVLLDPVLDAALRRDGYVVIDLAPPAELANLQTIYETTPSGIDTGYYASLNSADPLYKPAVDEAICSLVWPHLETRLANYDPLVGAFMVKHPGPETEVPPHQDWMIVDEDRRPSVNAWFPLTEVTAEVGRMAVLSGSHLWLDGLRGSPSFPTRHDGIAGQIREELMEPIEVAVGEALIYDTRLLHGTPPNLSKNTRVVAYINAVPSESPVIHWHRHAGGVDKYHVKRDFFTSFEIGTSPIGEIVERRSEYSLAPWTFEDFVERLNRTHQVPERVKVKTTIPSSAGQVGMNGTAPTPAAHGNRFGRLLGRMRRSG